MNTPPPPPDTDRGQPMCLWCPWRHAVRGWCALRDLPLKESVKQCEAPERCLAVSVKGGGRCVRAAGHELPHRFEGRW